MFVDLFLVNKCVSAKKTGRCSRPVVRAKLANWTDISDVALLRRLRNSDEWLRLLCIVLLRENVAYRLDEAISRTIRIVDARLSESQARRAANGGFCTASNCRVWCDFRASTHFFVPSESRLSAGFN